MEIYLIRHAIAENAAEGKKDEERNIIDKGFKETKKISKILKNLKAKPDFIISSPLTRAVQTADIIAKKFKYKKKIILAKELLPESKPSDIMELVKSKIDSKTKRIFIIGHMPLLGNFISFLLGVKNYTFDIEKSGVYIIDLNIDENNQVEGKLKGYLIPSIARRLA
ncbi:MAG: phosphohistidine phosphatase SixA [Spirochaetes bacterium]|nr:phosphohistidine phosphatase SixA [Spirochaetota bacterium]